MHPRSCVILLLSAQLAAAGAAPAAQRPRPLVDLPPATAGFRDHVGATRAAPRAVRDSAPAAYRAPDGQTVSVRFAAGYEPDAAVAQSYVDFLGVLPHGAELRRLRMTIAPPADVEARCGGVPGTLACYDPAASRMTVPGEEVEREQGVSTSYVVAHEYGHHVARWRSNAPFPSLAFGPKRWASEELVCRGTIAGRLAPGDEAERYVENPGEAWADTYAHLTYPDVPWQFTELLRPTEASLAAARADVSDPWTAAATRVFRGRFAPGDPNTRVFRVVLRLDGGLRIALDGPRGAELDLGLSSLGRERGATARPGARDVYGLRYACRDVRRERVNVEVRRRHGFGPFTVRVRYAG